MNKKTNLLKCRIHIYNGSLFMDEEVFIETTLPCRPHIGDVIYLSEEQHDTLKKMVNMDNVSFYIPQWAYYGSHGCEDKYKMNLDDISFVDAHTVEAIMLTQNDDCIDIEIT